MRRLSPQEWNKVTEHIADMCKTILKILYGYLENSESMIGYQTLVFEDQLKTLNEWLS